MNRGKEKPKKALVLLLLFLNKVNVVLKGF